jgi:hypothetical protein
MLKLPLSAPGSSQTHHDRRPGSPSRTGFRSLLCSLDRPDDNKKYKGRRVGLCGSTRGGNLVIKTVASQIIEYLGLIKCGLPSQREPRIADCFGFKSPDNLVLDFAHSRMPWPNRHQASGAVFTSSSHSILCPFPRRLRRDRVSVLDGMDYLLTTVQ